MGSEVWITYAKSEDKIAAIGDEGQDSLNRVKDPPNANKEEKDVGGKKGVKKNRSSAKSEYQENKGSQQKEGTLHPKKKRRGGWK